uniref:Secreted protein n=1 Tax=Arion vulgaris TaxID=1028688 RepID=A0A0B7A1K9_9EUPU
MATKTFIVLVLAAFAVTIISAQIAPECKLTQDEIRNDIMECVAHEPALLLQVIGHMQKPESMETTKFICQNQKDIVDLILCLENKFASCYPSARDLIMQYVPNQDRWSDALSFMCEHKNDLIETNCMDQRQTQEFMHCYLGKLTNTMQAVRENQDMQAAVCSVVHLEEQCFKTYHGACSQTQVGLFIQILDKLIPYCSEVKIVNKDQVNGNPLKFEPQGGARYEVRG